MRSRLVVLVVTAAVGWAGCVSQRPPERSELPRLADVIQPLAPCMVTVGEGDGAELVQVESDGAAAGVLEPGDVIRQVGGVTVLRVEDLLSTLRTWSPGDRVAVVFERDGETQSAELGLRSSPDDPDQPRLGVLVRTSYAAVAPADLPVDGIEPSATTRVVDLSGELLLFDPTSRRWQRLGMSTPEGDWLPAPGRIYLVEQTAAGATSALVELGSGTRTGLDLGDRPATSVLTMVGDLVLVTVSGETVVAIDPATGAPRWEWTPGDGPGGRALNPVTGFRSIDRSSALIALTEDPAAGQLSYTLVDAEGPVTDMETIPALDGMVVTGWHDEQRIAFRSVDGSGLSAVDLTSQEVVALDLPGLDLTSVSQLWPVGDGTNVLLDSGTRLVITEPGSDAEPVPVALNCRAQMRDPGW